VVLLAIVVVAYAGGGGGSTPDWQDAKIFNGNPTPVFSRGKGVAIDSNGGYLVGGNFNNGKLKFSNSYSLTATRTDMYIAKFSSTDVVEWASLFECYGETGYGEILSVAADSSSNFWVYGYFIGTCNLGNGNLSSFGRNSGFVSKVANNGTTIMAIMTNNPINVAVGKIYVDSNDNVYITGSYKGALSCGTVSLPQATNNEGFVFVLGANGSAVQGLGTSNSQIYTIIFGVAVDSNGTGYVTGRFAAGATFGSVSLSTNGSNLFVASFQSSSWVGAVTTELSGAGISPLAEGLDIVSNDAKIYITGRFQTGSGGYIKFGSVTLSSGSSDLFVSVLSNSLVFEESVQAHTSGGKGLVLAVDNNMNVWNSGFILDSADFSGVIVNSPATNTYLSKVNYSGVFSNLIYSTSTTGESMPNAMAISSTNKVVIVGDVVGKVEFGGDSLSTSAVSLYVATYQI
jgi:hypothetical protein